MFSGWNFLIEERKRDKLNFNSRFYVLWDGLFIFCYFFLEEVFREIRGF